LSKNIFIAIGDVIDTDVNPILILKKKLKLYQKDKKLNKYIKIKKILKI